MKTASAACRDRLTAEDFDFLAQTLAQTPSQSTSLGSLLCDEETRNLILDHDAVYESLVDDTGCLRVSAALYFYVLTRRMLRQAGLEERALCDYVAGVLAAFSNTRQLLPPPPAHASGTPKHFLYISDLLEALNQAPQDQVFVLRSYLGDYTLFLSGVWNEHLEARLEKKGAPGIDFYESVGQKSYRMAASHPQAQQHDLKNVYEQLASDFHTIRLALNRLAENLLHLSPVNPALFLKKT